MQSGLFHLELGRERCWRSRHFGVTRSAPCRSISIIGQVTGLFMQTSPGLSKELNEITIQLRAEYAPRIADLAGEIARVYGQRIPRRETAAPRRNLLGACSNGSPGLPRTS